MAQQANPEESLGDRLKVSVTGRNLQVTDALRQHILEKIARVEEVTPQVIDVQVFLEVQREVHKVEIIYKFSHFKVFAQATDTDMYQSLHHAIARLRRKLHKWKTRIQNHHAKKPSHVELDIQVLDHAKEEIEEINDEIEEENFSRIEDEFKLPKIVKKKKRTLKRLTTDEAIMKMELTDDNFMVYRAEEDQKLKVIYTRRNRTLGILEIE